MHRLGTCLSAPPGMPAGGLNPYSSASRAASLSDRLFSRDLRWLIPRVTLKRRFITESVNEMPVLHHRTIPVSARSSVWSEEL